MNKLKLLPENSFDEIPNTAIKDKKCEHQVDKERCQDDLAGEAPARTTYHTARGHGGRDEEEHQAQQQPLQADGELKLLLSYLRGQGAVVVLNEVGGDEHGHRQHYQCHSKQHGGDYKKWQRIDCSGKLFPREVGHQMHAADTVDGLVDGDDEAGQRA